MAKQKGFLKIEGSLGDTSFVKTKNGYIAKTKSVISASKIKTDPNFQRTRENMSEFGKAATAGKLIRSAVVSLSKETKDASSIGRLVKTMVKLIQSDTVSARGQRMASKGKIQLLEGFNFNQSAELSSCFHAPFTGLIDRVTGALSVNIPSFVPAAMVAAPKGATHFKLVSAGVELDFDNGVTNRDINESAILPLDNNATALLNIVNTVTASSTHSLCLFLGIQFLELLNGVYYPLNNNSFNSLSILKTA